MSVSAKKIFGSALVSGVCALAFGTSAHALESGQCMPTAEMKKALAAEGQKILITGALQNGNEIINVFTSNDNGTRGYNIEGNTPFGTPSTRSCVSSTYTNVVLYNHEVVAPIPASARFPNGDRKVAEEYCAGRGGCRYHEDFIQATYRRGNRVMLTADLIVDGEASLKLFLTANPNDKFGQVSVTEPTTGVNEYRFSLGKVGFTQEGSDYYDRQTGRKKTELATAQPN